MTRPLPAWLTALVDQRLALIDESVAALAPTFGIVMTMVKELPPGATPEELEVWERTCDACGADCTHSEFWTGHVQRESKSGQMVVMTYGVCRTHKAGLDG